MLFIWPLIQTFIVLITRQRTQMLVCIGTKFQFHYSNLIRLTISWTRDCLDQQVTTTLPAWSFLHLKRRQPDRWHPHTKHPLRYQMHAIIKGEYHVTHAYAPSSPTQTASSDYGSTVRVDNKHRANTIVGEKFFSRFGTNLFSTWWFMFQILARKNIFVCL